MLKHGLLIFLLVYLISCTSSNQNGVTAGIGNGAIPVKVGLKDHKKEVEKVKHFGQFMEALSKRQMIPASESDLHQKIQNYLPDSTVSEGYDLHLREIGRIDTFRLVFHEYFDLYDDWSKTYLDIFSPSGQALSSKRLWDLSFEGSININFIDNKIIELAYHDFFKATDLIDRALIPDQHFYIHTSSKSKQIVEGTVYEYYTIEKQGILKKLSQRTQASTGRRFPQSSSKLLSSSELKQFSLDEIELMKNEILAERGHIFTDISTQEYFETQAWYQGKSNQVDSLFSDIERLNFEHLEKIRKEY